MSGTASAVPTKAGTPTASNPYGMSPSLQAFQQGLQGLSSSLNAAGTMPNSSNYMRPNAQAAYTQGTPNNLLQQILQMRLQQSQALGTPFTQGTAMPRVSLLNG